jgi:hypothetical protein
MYPALFTQTAPHPRPIGDEPVEFLNCMLLRVKLLTLSKISASTQIGSLQAVFFQNKSVANFFSENEKKTGKNCCLHRFFHHSSK